MECTVRDLNYQLKQLGRRNRDGSRSTQAMRERLLSQIATQLRELGYRHVNVNGLKPKHVESLVSRWLEERLAPATVKNRMAAIRWWAEKINKQHVVARDNSHYGIPERVYIDGSSKARDIGPEQLKAVRDENVRMSLRLQAAFGLRREEAIKFIPVQADQGTHMVLAPSWTKGGRGRVLSVSSGEQRDLLDEAKVLAGRGSLIPAARSYRQQLRIYERHTANAGLSKLHGLRHAYAQRRYRALTGWPAPINGGPARADLTDDQCDRDRLARAIISRELGHERERVTAIYLGQ